jgi:hypothetical protein
MLTCEYLDRADSEWVVVLPIDLDDGHVVAVDRECEIWVARQRNKAESIPARRLARNKVIPSKRGTYRRPLMTLTTVRLVFLVLANARPMPLIRVASGTL